MENIPASGPYLLTTNHFSRPGFGGAWWLTFALSAALPVEVYWVMTGAWIFPGKFYEAPMRILSTWLFRRIASVYGFTNMPPIEPYSSDVQGRARSVRRVLEYARSSPNPVVGLAPEGQDMPGGVLGMPPPGLGRFVALLAPLCQVILPAGIYEDGERLCVRFGTPYRLEIPAGLTNDQLDAHASLVVMRAIAKLLPERWRGTYQD
jgi:1-acyl-sn-glycerol-3-phosphate acyltransferase